MAQDWARPVVHWEIEAADPERQRAFYGDLFNWQIGDGFIMQIPPASAAPSPAPAGHIRGSERSGVTLYVQVADLRGRSTGRSRSAPPSWPSRSTSPAAPPWPASPTPRETP